MLSVKVYYFNSVTGKNFILFLKMVVEIKMKKLIDDDVFNKRMKKENK